MTHRHGERTPSSAALLPSHFQPGTGSLVAVGAASLPASPARAPQESLAVEEEGEERDATA